MATPDALSSFEQESEAYTRYFFVPSELAAQSNEVSPVKAAEDDVVSYLHADLAIVNNGVKFKSQSTWMIDGCCSASDRFETTPSL